MSYQDFSKSETMSKSDVQVSHFQVKKRSCTDIICLGIFIVFVAGMFACSIIGYVHGNLDKLLHPTDSLGNICGKGKFEDRPHLMFFDPLQCGARGVSVIRTGCPTPQVCVKECPKENYVFAETLALEIKAGKKLKEERQKMLCKYGVDPMAANSVKDLISNDDCAAYYVMSVEVVGRCIPSIFKSSLEKLTTKHNFVIKQKNGKEVTLSGLDKSSKSLAKYLSYFEGGLLFYQDLAKSWKLMLFGAGITVILAMIWIFIMRWIAWPIVWFSIFSVFAVGIFAAYYSFTKYNKLKYVDVAVKFGLSESFSHNWSFFITSKYTWLACGVFWTVVMLILLLVLIFLRSRIFLAVVILKQCSKAIGYMVSVLFWPLVPFLMLVAFVSYWCISITYIATISTSEYYRTENKTDGINRFIQRIPCTPNETTEKSKICDFVKYGGNKYVTFLQVYMLFMFVWILNFITALSNVVVSGGFCSYYWAFNKPEDIPVFPIASSLWQTIRYHLGSLAFGSLIITLVVCIRIVTEVLQKRLVKAENKAAQFVLKCLGCLFWCFEKVLKFLTKSAYVMIAMQGTNFCISAKNAFFLRINNITRSVVVEKTSDFVIFVCKILMTASVFLISSAWFQGDIPFFKREIPDINSYLSPVICLTITSYIIASVFLSVYSIGVTSLLLCFLTDMSENNGSEEKPYYMTQSLQESFVYKKN